MKKMKLFILKNAMLFANGLANFIAVYYTMNYLYVEPIPNHILGNPIFYWTDIFYSPVAFTFVATMTLIYEQPIRIYLNTKFRNKSVPKDLRQKARQSLLNEPFILITLDLSVWLLAALIYSFLFWILDGGSFFIQRALFLGLMTGFITVTIAFFFLEYVLQKHLAFIFFPKGGLCEIPKTLRIRISTRLIVLLFACNLIPLLSIVHIFHRITGNYKDAFVALNHFGSVLLNSTYVFIGAGICLTLLVSINLTLPFGEIIQTLRHVRNGNFGKKVKVTSNDEIGYTGDVINEMTEGLIERERLQQSLNLAREVQQNLLPNSNLKINGVDIAGKSIYCDETGGDYYDFVSIGGADKQKIGVAIGDVSGHGISSALLMAAVRSSLRLRASLSGSIAKIITDVNSQLARDVEDSGHFMTMFFLALNTETKQIEWVRAGHDPAIIYDPSLDSFNELKGSGIALGVDDEWVYEDITKTFYPNGQIIFLSTDGVWEARNKKGDMLGKDPILRSIRKNASSDATQIIDSIFSTLDRFIDGAKIDDDITSVVIKIEAGSMES